MIAIASALAVGFVGGVLLEGLRNRRHRVARLSPRLGVARRRDDELHRRSLLDMAEEASWTIQAIEAIRVAATSAADSGRDDGAAETAKERIEAHVVEAKSKEITP